MDAQSFNSWICLVFAIITTILAITIGKKCTKGFQVLILFIWFWSIFFVAPLINWYAAMLFIRGCF